MASIYFDILAGNEPAGHVSIRSVSSVGYRDEKVYTYGYEVSSPGSKNARGTVDWTGDEPSPLRLAQLALNDHFGRQRG